MELRRRSVPEQLRYLADVLLTGVEGEVPERDQSSIAVGLALRVMAEELERP